MRIRLLAFFLAPPLLGGAILLSAMWADTVHRWIPLTCISSMQIHSMKECRESEGKLRCAKSDIEMAVGCTSAKKPENEQPRAISVTHPTAVLLDQ